MDPNQVRFVTQRYDQLQGLKLLPVAAFFLIFAMVRIGRFGPNLHDQTWAAALWYVAGLAAAVILASVIRGWYTRTFGFVSPLQSGVRPFGFLIGFVGAVLYWRVPSPTVFIAVELLCVGIAHRATQKRYIAVALMWFVMTLVAFQSSNAAAVVDLATALCLVILGVGDHRLLRQTLQPQIDV